MQNAEEFLLILTLILLPLQYLLFLQLHFILACNPLKHPGPFCMFCCPVQPSPSHTQPLDFFPPPKYRTFFAPPLPLREIHYWTMMDLLSHFWTMFFFMKMPTYFNKSFPYKTFLDIHFIKMSTLSRIPNITHFHVPLTLRSAKCERGSPFSLIYANRKLWKY